MSNEVTVRQIFTPSRIEVREGDGTAGGPHVIEGYAVRFGERSRCQYRDTEVEVYEVIDPGAITRELLDGCDIRLTVFHDDLRILGRSRRGEGTLTYDVDEQGVRYRCELPDTADGRMVYELVRRGDLAGSSFKFEVFYADATAVETITEQADDGHTIAEVHIRRVERVLDFTVAANPVYPTTTAEVRDAIEGAVSGAAQVAAQAGEPVAQTEETVAQAEEPTVQASAPDGAQAAPADEESGADPDEEIDTQEAEVLARAIDSHYQNHNPQNQAEMPNRETTSQGPSLTTLVRDAIAQRPGRVEFIIQQRAEGEGGGSQTPATPTDTVQPNTITTTHADAGSLVPLHVQQVIDDVEEGLIYDKVGINLTHSNAGEFVWPYWTAGAVQIVGETEKLVPSELTVGKLTARPERMGITFEMSYESFYQTEGVMEKIVRKALALAAQRGINALLLSPTKPKGAASIQGPFVAAKAKAVTLPSNLTYKSINAIKAKLLETGLALNPVWVMSAARNCELEATPRDAGSGIMMIEDGKLSGYPVFVSHQVTDDYLFLGDFAYQPAGFFGEMRLIVDPYTGADRNMIKITLNFGFATTTLRPAAFVAGKFATA